eukprot:366345-Chlamydomonas_euryale.AAC.11
MAQSTCSKVVQSLHTHVCCCPHRQNPEALAASQLIPPHPSTCPTLRPTGSLCSMVVIRRDACSEVAHEAREEHSRRLLLAQHARRVLENEAHARNAATAYLLVTANPDAGPFQRVGAHQAAVRRVNRRHRAGAGPKRPSDGNAAA